MESSWSLGRGRMFFRQKNHFGSVCPLTAEMFHIGVCYSGAFGDVVFIFEVICFVSQIFHHLFTPALTSFSTPKKGSSVSSTFHFRTGMEMTCAGVDVASGTGPVVAAASGTRLLC